MKKYLIAILTLVILIGTFVPLAFAEEEICVIVNGTELKTDVPPQIIEDRTMVPFRAIFEALGVEVEWNSYLHQVKVETDEIYLSLFVSGVWCTTGDALSFGESQFRNIRIPMEVLPVIYQDRTLVPVRVVSEVMGCDVSWDAENRIVTITSRNEDGCHITMYAPDGRTVRVPYDEMSEYKQVGWYSEPVVTVYALNDQTTVAVKHRVDEWIKKGWYEVPVQRVYAADGRDMIIPQAELEDYLQVGWYENPVQTLYAVDGRTVVVDRNEVEAYIHEGWYTEPVYTMYSLDNWNGTIMESDLETYRNNGWAMEKRVIVHAPDGRFEVIPETELAAYRSVGWNTLEAEKARYNLRTVDGITAFINRFYPTVRTAVGNYTFEAKGYESMNTLRIQVTSEDIYQMLVDISSNTDYSVEQRVQAKKDIKHHMYVLANDVMGRTDVPVEIQYHRGGYQYPNLKVGYSAIRFCTCRNYEEEYVKASDGSNMREIRRKSFHWYDLIDDHKF